MAKYIKVGYKTPARIAAFKEMIKKSVAARQKRAEEEFWTRVDKQTDSGCWIWTGSGQRGRYGHIKRRGKTTGTHRHVYEMHFGPIPEGMMVCHKCDNKRCVNPDHLFLGTNSDNQVDSFQKGRPPVRGEQHGNSRFTDNEIKEVRKLYSSGLASQRELAARFGVVQSHMSRIINRRRWRHVA